MGSSWMLRAERAPELFLGTARSARGRASTGFARFVADMAPVRPRERARASALARDPEAAVSIALPRELVQLFATGAGRAVGDFVPAMPTASTRTPGSRTTARTSARSAGAPLRPDAFATLLAAARRNPIARARLTAFLAGTLPFGATRSGELWLYVLAEPTSPSRGVIATLDPAVPGAPHPSFRGASAFAFACALAASEAAGADASRITELRTRLPSPGVAEQEAVRASFERAATLLGLVLGSDAVVRRAAKKVATRPFEPPHPPAKLPPRGRSAAEARRRARAAVPPSSATRMLVADGDRVEPLALGPLVEAFFRKEGPELDAILLAQQASLDALVREAATILASALVTARPPRTALARDLARRRAMALRAARAEAKPVAASSADRAQLTRRIVELVDAAGPATDPLATTEPREEALLALAELGDRSAVPALVARAVTGDVGAVDMLAALGDPSAVPPLVGLLHREPQRYRLLEAAVVRALAALEASSELHALRTLLADNPMPSWREGIERGVLVKELVSALGTLRDEHAGPRLLDVLEATSQEYRAILPVAAWALGRIRHLPALATLERLLSSPKEPPTCEAIWAVGAIGAAHPAARARAVTLLDRLGGLEPGAEMVRLTALGKVRGFAGEASRATELRSALETALWEPAFRQEESSRRRTWALRSLEELAAARAARPAGTRHHDDVDPYFLGHEAVRYFVTRDDHRVRRAAEDAFTAWGVPVPQTRRYYVFVLDDLEARGGLGALHEALRDPLGVFRHNVATRLADRAEPSSVRPLAEATARLFAEPPTSTYEYDDAPSHLVAFVRALAKLNRPEGNDVLIEGLRAGNHQVRAVVAENAPADQRFVPELMAMLGDPRSFLRSRAERSLAALGINPEPHRGSDQPPRLAPL
jgi:HEAT repeat protein